MSEPACACCAKQIESLQAEVERLTNILGHNSTVSEMKRAAITPVGGIPVFATEDVPEGEVITVLSEDRPVPVESFRELWLGALEQAEAQNWSHSRVWAEACMKAFSLSGWACFRREAVSGYRRTTYGQEKAIEMMSGDWDAFKRYQRARLPGAGSPFPPPAAY